MRPQLLAAEERTLEVCVQHCIEVLFAHAQDQIIAGNARVVHKDIHPAKGVHRLFKERFAALGSGNIGLHSHSICIFGLAQSHRLGSCSFAVAVIHHDIAALLCQLDAHSPANAPASASNNGGADDRFFAHSSSFHAVSAALSCSGVSTEAQTTPGRVFFTKPARALPGPTSRIWSTPSSPRRWSVSSM